MKKSILEGYIFTSLGIFGLVFLTLHYFGFKALETWFSYSPSTPEMLVIFLISLVGIALPPTYIEALIAYAFSYYVFGKKDAEPPKFFKRDDSAPPTAQK